MVPTKQRYHIHICIVRNEKPELENALQQALSDRYFLTWDLIGHPATFMDYSRQQIDRCDYLLFVLGNGYGYISPSGVSYLHLSYIYAATKRKPMLALVKTHSTSVTFTRQRLDLASLIQRDQGESVMAFYQVADVIAQLDDALHTLLSARPQRGWTRAGYAISHDAALSASVTTATSVSTDGDKGDYLFSQPSTPSLFYPKSLSDNTPSQDEADRGIPPAVDANLMAQDTRVLVNYSAHAYQDGNLQDIMAAHTFTWGEIIELLRELPTPFSSDMMQRRLNESLKPAALVEAKKTRPNVHAVSRCQINAVDFQWVKKQLTDNQWLLAAKESRMGRELWQINPLLKF